MNLYKTEQFHIQDLLKPIYGSSARLDGYSWDGYSLEQAQVVGTVGIVGIIGMVWIVGINK